MVLTELCRESFYKMYGGEPSDYELERLSEEVTKTFDLPLVVLACRSVERPECSTATEAVVFDFHDIPDGYYVDRINGRYVIGRCPLCGDFLLEGGDGCEMCLNDTDMADEIRENDPISKKDLEAELENVLDIVSEATREDFPNCLREMEAYILKSMNIPTDILEPRGRN